MDKLNGMQVFVRVAELGSFTRTADSLGLPKASVSTLIRQLESHMGVRLLHRTTRSVRLTQDGQLFFERCQDVLDDVEELEAMFQRGASIGGRLRVDMPTAIARNVMIPHLPDFLATHPGIEIELGSTDRRVDLIAEGYDCVVRVGTLADSGLIARPLGSLSIVNCASPAYLQRYGVPNTLADLAEHQIVHYASPLGSHAPAWECLDGERYRQVKIKAALIVNNTDAYSAACLAGLGMIQVPYVGARQYLDSGALMEVLPQHRASPMPVAMVYPHRRHLSRRLQVFMDWVTAQMREYVDH